MGGTFFLFLASYSGPDGKLAAKRSDSAPLGGLLKISPRLLDEAFRLATKPFNDATHDLARAELQHNNPDTEPTIIDQAYSSARKLVDECYHFGDRCRDKLITDEEALAEMEKRFPGFPKSTYKSALGYGYFISR